MLQKVLLTLCKNLHGKLGSYIGVLKLKLSSRNLALVAIFAAIYYVFSLISPYIPAIGLPDLVIRLEALMASVFGFVLGPYLGAGSAFLGALVAWTLPPVAMNPLEAPFLLAPPINALIVGLIFYRRWKWAFALFGLLIAAFLFLPPSQPITQYYYVSAAVLWDKAIALLLIIPIIRFRQEFSNQKYLPMLFFFISFVGNQADNMWGTDVFAVPFVYEVLYAPALSPLLGTVASTYLDIVRYLFVVSPFIYPAIRLIQAVLATIIAVPLMNTLKNTMWTIKERSIIDVETEAKGEAHR